MSTQKGLVIAVMHQVAYTGKGESIVSSLQLEGSSRVLMINPSRLVVSNTSIPSRAVPYPQCTSQISLCLVPSPTDTELEELPMVMLTADIDWDPAIFDNKLEDEEEWFNALQDIPHLSADPFFDEFGDYRHVHHVTKAISCDSVIENSIITDLPCTFHEYETRIKPKAIDFEHFHSTFAWQPVDIVKRTFDNTTQFYHSIATPSMKQHYKSPCL